MTTPKISSIEKAAARQSNRPATASGVSVKAAHRRIRRESLSGKAHRPASFKEYLRQMPDVGPDSLFDQPKDLDRKVDL